MATSSPDTAQGSAQVPPGSFQTGAMSPELPPRITNSPQYPRLMVSLAVSRQFPAEGGHRSLLLDRERRALRPVPCRRDEPSTR